MGAGDSPDALVGQVADAGAAGLVVARPGLVRRLGGPARVTVVSAPPGSGKTVLLQSWIGQAGLQDRVAWVPAGPDERDPGRFWLSVLGALRQTAVGGGLVQPVTAAPDLDGWSIVERLLADLAPLAGRLWLVIDDVHELEPEALRQLELLVMRAPPRLRFVLATRHDVRLGLHRLRLEGRLAEIRGNDLRFSLDEARELFAVAGVELPESALVMLHERTEGWAAGLRLAALCLAGHPDPERFAAEFSGTERTVAEYLLAEVLDRQSEGVRRLLLRTSVLGRVNGELADLLTGDAGGERVLQDLEEANAFVVSLDPARTWFRYHQLFADLLHLELRRTAPGEVTTLNLAAAGWLAVHGCPVEAIRHAQAAGDWELAARLLARNAAGLYLDGQTATKHELLAAFPAEARAEDAELAAMAAEDELAYGSLESAERYVGLAERGIASVPADRRGQFQVVLGVDRLLLARQSGNLATVEDQARRLEALARAPEAGQPGEELRALALISVGITEYWAKRFDEAERQLEESLALARRIGRPFLEFMTLAYQAAVAVDSSFEQAAEHGRRTVELVAERGRRTVELARRHGWTDEPTVVIAYLALAAVLVWQGRPEEAELWVQRAERTVRMEADPAAGTGVLYFRGLLELARGRDAEALAASRSAERLAERLAAPHALAKPVRLLLTRALVRLGQTENAEQAIAGFGEHERDKGELRIVRVMLRLAQNDPHAGLAALAPVLDGSAPVGWQASLVEAFLLEAIARDALGDPDAADRALERALDRAESEGALLAFLVHPVPGLLERHTRHRTAHAALIAEIQDRLAGIKSALPSAAPRPPIEPLRQSELRVLRYLPTNLTAPEIASELYVSLNTVKTHTRNLYTKLGTHHRAEAVARARSLGLLAPSALSAR
jgi:LuxR family transcriptional regulator, maltose regulon positive regulatory protein